MVDYHSLTNSFYDIIKINIIGTSTLQGRVLIAPTQIFFYLNPTHLTYSIQIVLVTIIGMFLDNKTMFSLLLVLVLHVIMIHGFNLQNVHQLNLR